MNLDMDFGTWYAEITRRVDLRIRDRMQTIMQGSHPSIWRGRGDDFDSFQPHTLGEETTHIDWKASERLEEGFLVRKLREERVLDVWIAVDLSASMWTGFSPESCKQRLLLDIVAVIGRSLVHQQDQLGVIGFDRAIRTVVDPFRSEKAFVSLLQMLWAFEPEPGTTTSYSQLCNSSPPTTAPDTPNASVWCCSSPILKPKTTGFRPYSGFGPPIPSFRFGSMSLYRKRCLQVLASLRIAMWKRAMRPPSSPEPGSSWCKRNNTVNASAV